MLRIYAQSLDGHWNGSLGHVVGTILDDNPFGGFDLMDLGDTGAWSTLNTGYAHQALQEHTAATAYFSSLASPELFGSIACDPERITALVRCEDADIERVSTQGAQLFLRRLVASLPNPGWGSIEHQYRMVDFYALHGLRTLPDCFRTYLRWFHLLTPMGYAPYFAREALLQTPAHSITEETDGTIAITVFENPLAYDSQQAKRQLIEATSYLNSVRKDVLPC